MQLIQTVDSVLSWRLLLDLRINDGKEMEKPHSRQGQQPQISSSPSSVPALSPATQTIKGACVCMIVHVFL